MVDARLNFKQHAEHLSIKASGVKSSLSRLMPNIGGPKQRRRALLSSVITSVLTYGISIRVNALQLQKVRRKVAPVYRLSALRVASAYRTVSEDAEIGSTDRSRTQCRREAEESAALAAEVRYLYQREMDPPSDPSGVDADLEHVFFRCPRFSESRRTWESALEREVLPENLVEAMLSLQTAWDATSNFVAEVMKELRSEERKRKTAV
ncbi:uncharacterized protein LOC107042315 [Diachasma alloeum]|uniref:uncharacterized protein LOC107042315 n=1 Tax=Diachasma alloeum TaxID=454923 RepID=UPI0007382412|nr:uncharacterized protein LOC107042315 [Diachasma alloeum]